MEKVRCSESEAQLRSAHRYKTNFRDGKGKVYMTHPTKALHKFMMQDFVRMRCVHALMTEHFV